MNTKKILLIDDDESFRRMLRILLERSGYDVMEAANGRDGIRRFGHSPADLVITDMVMPDMEGIETIRALREADDRVPIIAISGGGIGAAGAYLNAACRLGAACSFSKPFDRNEFLRTVACELEHNRNAGAANEN